MVLVTGCHYEMYEARDERKIRPGVHLQEGVRLLREFFLGSATHISRIGVWVVNDGMHLIVRLRAKWARMSCRHSSSGV